MPRIDEVIESGPELAKSQRDVLALLDSHPDHIFGTTTEDIEEIQRWLKGPDEVGLPQPQVLEHVKPGGYSPYTIRWTIGNLLAHGKIGSIELQHRTYYGSHEAIRQAKERLDEMAWLATGEELAWREALDADP